MSGSINEHTQTSSEIGIGCQRNGQQPIICQVVALCSQSRSCRLQQGSVPKGAVHYLGN